MLEVSNGRHYDADVDWHLLSGVDEEDVRRLLSATRRRRFARNEVVFHHDDLGDSLHLIVKGRFAIRIVAPYGESAMIRVRGPGEHFGEMALFSEGPRRAATVFALEAAETFAVPASVFERFREAHPELNGVLLQLLAAEIRLVDERLLELLYLSANKRLLRRLCELAALYDRGGPEIEVSLTQEQLAELANTSRATVNAVLSGEQRRGTLRLARGSTIVLDLDSLRSRAR
jgi:CRP/FNR family transcriptional regulator, cyclic AMP receptor protein